MKFVFLLLIAFFAFSTLSGTTNETDETNETAVILHPANIRPESVRGATLIVGSTRASGDIPQPFHNIFGLDSACFDHTRSFPGTVISVDMRPCARSDLPHIRGNWLDLLFQSNSQKRVVFEWFPTHCRSSSVPPSTPYSDALTPVYHEYQPLLLPALIKAFKVLEPGGILTIDYIPYSHRLPSSQKAAIKALRQFGVPNKVLTANILNKLTLESKELPGIVSALWQQYDPFSISISKCEINDILQFLEDEACVLLDQQTDTEVIKRAIRKTAEFAGINNPDTKNALIQELKKEIKGKACSEIVKVFRLVYGIKSREHAMITKLRDIGFEVKNDTIPCFKDNPYNGRRHAFIIEARKPKVSPTRAKAGSSSKKG